MDGLPFELSLALARAAGKSREEARKIAFECRADAEKMRGFLSHLDSSGALSFIYGPAAPEVKEALKIEEGLDRAVEKINKKEAADQALEKQREEIRDLPVKSDPLPDWSITPPPAPEKIPAVGPVTGWAEGPQPPTPPEMTPNSLVNPVVLDGWGIPVRPASSYPEPPSAAAKIAEEEKPPIAPWANPACKGCNGTGYNSKGGACAPCKKLAAVPAAPAPKTETVVAQRGKPNKPDLIIQVPVNLGKQLDLDLAGGAPSSVPENAAASSTKPVASTPSQTIFSTDYMTCDNCPTDDLVVSILDEAKGKASYTCQGCGCVEKFDMSAADIIELKAKGKPVAMVPVKVKSAASDEVFKRSDVKEPKPEKTKSKKAQAASEPQATTMTAQSPSQPPSNSQDAQPLSATKTEPLPEPQKSSQSTPETKSLVDSLLAPSPASPSASDVLARAEFEALVAGWDKAKLISKWEDLTKKSYVEGMPLGAMAEQVVNGMLGE